MIRCCRFDSTDTKPYYFVATERKTMKKLGSLPILGFCLLLASCGGGGGGSGGSGSSSNEIVYALSTSATSSTTQTSSIVGNCTTGTGCITEYAYNSSTGSFYSGEAQIATGGTSPFQIIFDPNGSYAYVLNNNNATADETNAGSISTFKVTSVGLEGASSGSYAPVYTKTTGSNPYAMAVDPLGSFLVVANHGNGDGVSTNGGGVQVYALSSGQLTLQGSSGSPCYNPDTVVFPTNADGTTNEPVYVVCTSPEQLVTGTTSYPPAPAIYSCTIGNLESGTCSSISMSNFSTTLVAGDALYNLVVDASNGMAYAPGYSQTKGGFILAFTISGGSLNSPNTSYATAFSTTNFVPSGKIGIVTQSGVDYVLVGSYPSTSVPGTDDIIDVCHFSGSPGTCHEVNTALSGTTYNYPLAFTVGSNNVYLALSGTNLQTGGTGTAGILVYTNTSVTTTSPSPDQSLGAFEPTEVTINSTGSFAAVPYAGTNSVEFYSLQSNGTINSSSGVSLTTNGNPSLAYIH